MSTWTIYGKANERQPGGAITLSISIRVSDDAPPTLVRAVGETIGRMLQDIGITDEQAEQIVAEVEERDARTQRQADHAARQLLGDTGPQEGP
jgi:hypothetical protein